MASTLYDRASADFDDHEAIRRLKAEGYTRYAEIAAADDQPGRYLFQRVRPESHAADEQARATEAQPEMKADFVSGADLGDAIGARAIVAFSKAGYDKASDILALSDEDLAGIPGIGPATITKIQNLR